MAPANPRAVSGEQFLFRPHAPRPRSFQEDRPEPELGAKLAGTVLGLCLSVQGPEQMGIFKNKRDSPKRDGMVPFEQLITPSYTRSCVPKQAHQSATSQAPATARHQDQLSRQHPDCSAKRALPATGPSLQRCLPEEPHSFQLSGENRTPYQHTLTSNTLKKHVNSSPDLLQTACTIRNYMFDGI